MATLRVVPTQPTVEQVELEVLTDAAAAMASWAERLPAESGWRWVFVKSGREIADTVDYLAGREE